MLVDHWDAATCGEEELLAKQAMLGLHACYDCPLSEKEDDVSRGVVEGHAFDFHRCLVRLNVSNAVRCFFGNWPWRRLFPAKLGFIETKVSEAMLLEWHTAGGGGTPTARGMSTAALLKFCSKEDLPRILEPR